MSLAAVRLGLPAQVDACLFDLDGVLVQTSQLHEQAWARMFDEFLKARSGEDPQSFTQNDYDQYVDGKLRADGTRSFLNSRGITLPEGSADDASGSATVVGLSKRKNDILLKLIDEVGVATYEGSVRYLRAAHDAGLRCVVVSSSENAEQALASAGLTDLIDGRIDGHVAAERGLAGKPAPDTFLAGAHTAGVTPEHAAVFEDAVAGVAAGHAGRFGFVVGVDRVGHAAALTAGGADLVVTDLADLIH